MSLRQFVDALAEEPARLCRFADRGLVGSKSAAFANSRAKLVSSMSLQQIDNRASLPLGKPSAGLAVKKLAVGWAGMYPLRVASGAAHQEGGSAPLVGKTISDNFRLATMPKDLVVHTALPKARQAICFWITSVIQARLLNFM